MKSYLYSLPFVAIAAFMAAVVPARAEDCATIGQTVASEQGGRLTKATAVMKNGRDVCVVIVLVPGRNGEKPRRVEVAVPAH